MRIIFIIGSMVALLGLSTATISPQVIGSLAQQGTRAKREDTVNPKVEEPFLLGGIGKLSDISPWTASPSDSSSEGNKAKREAAVSRPVLTSILGGGRKKRTVPSQGIPSLLTGGIRKKRAPVDPKVAEPLVGRGKRSVESPVLETLIRGKREANPTDGLLDVILS